MRNDEINTDGNERLLPLSNSKDFKVAKDNPDVRGWRVVGSDGEKLGLVKDLIVDTQEMKVRYLALTADKRFYNDSYDRYLLVPIGAAALDKKGSNVFVSSIDSRTILNYPTYQGGPITDDYELAVRNASGSITPGQPVTDRTNLNTTDQTNAVTNQYTTPGTAATVAPQRISSDFYNDDNYNENRFYTSNQTDKHDERSGLSRDNVNTDIYPGRTDTTEGNRPNVEESISTIERLEQLRVRGSITEDEFKVLKKRALDL
jgi:photosynthetic reaction center H subunit